MIMGFKPARTAVSMSEFKRGWGPVLGGAFGMATGCSSLPFYTLGVLVGPLSAAFGWTRGAISMVTLCATIANIVALPLAGRAAGRFGVRPVVMLSLIGVSLVFLSCIFLNAWIGSFYICWMALNFVGAGTYPPFWTREVAAWFDKNRGLAIGLVLLGSGLGSVVAPPLVAKAIDLWTWRGGFVVLAFIPVGIGLPMVYLFFRSAPADKTLEVAPAQTVARPGPDVSLSQALKRRPFWHMALGIFLAGGVLAGFIVNLIPMVSGQGFSRGLSVGLASEMGIAIMAGRPLTGLLLDRIAAPYVGGLVFFVCGLALFGMSLGPSLPLIHIIVVLVGLSAGAEVDIVTYAVSRYFGIRSYSEICAWLFSAFAVGGGFAPIGAGLLFDAFGSYALPLRIGSSALIVASLLFATLGTAPKHDEPQVGRFFQRV